jgi:hypothetical protein
MNQFGVRNAETGLEKIAVETSKPALECKQ